VTLAAPETVEPSVTASRSTRLLAIAEMLLGPAILVALFSGTGTDPDLWGHLRYGLDFLDSERVIQPDVYSYTTGEQLWINHEWLAEAGFAAAYRLAGAAGLIWFKLFLATSIGVIIYRGLRFARLAPLRAWTVVAVCALPLMAGMATVRPHLFTYLAFAILLCVLVRAEGGQTRGLIVLPPLFLIWANSHGGFLAGIALLVLWALTSMVGAAAERVRTGQLPGLTILVAAGTVLVCVTATLVNPYGAGLWRFLVETATLPRPEIIEWRPLSITSPLGLLYLILVAIGAGAFLCSRQSQRSLFRTLGFIGLALAPLVAVRHTSLFSIALPLLVAPELSSAWSPRQQRDRAGPQQRATAVLLVGVILAISVLLGVGWYRGRCLEVEPGFYPSESVEILRRSNVTGNLAVDFNWGEYVIWQLGPGIKVSVDGRRETVYPETVYQDNQNFKFGQRSWDALLRKYNTDLALVLSEGAAANLLELAPGWTRVHQDAISALFVRNDSGKVEALLAAQQSGAPMQPPLCFPSSR